MWTKKEILNHAESRRAIGYSSDTESLWFSSRQAFCNHLGISQSTMANRYARDTFPADWVVICSMETGVPVEWLAFGTDTEKGRITNNAEKVTTIVTASINISIENKTSKMRTFYY